MVSKLFALVTASLFSFAMTSSLSYGKHSDLPTTYNFPGNNTRPEGIAIQPNSPYFYSASTTDGTIYRGHLGNSEVKPFIDGSNVANMTIGVGIHVHGPYLVVAGGTSGIVYVFNVHTRALVHRFTNGLSSSATFLNDLAIHPETGDVYISDTTNDTLWHIPGASLAPSDTVDVDLTPFMTLSPVVDYSPGFNGNGVVFTSPDNSNLIFADSNNGTLYSIDLTTKSITPIDLHGGHLGGPDGLLYKHPYLFSVNGFHGDPADPKTDYIAVIELAQGFSEGKVVGNVTNPELLKAPATIDILPGGKEFLATNFQGEATKPVLPFTVVRIPIEW